MTGADADVIAGVRRDAADDTGVAGALRAALPLAGTGDLLAASRHAHIDLFGAGPLEPLLAHPDVSDVLVNGPGPVWVDRGEGVEDSGVRIDDEASLRRLAQRLVVACGRRLDDAAPFADARLPDGTRVHAVLPPVAPQGTTLSLRVPARRGFALDDLVVRAALPADGAVLLRRLVQARASFVVTGGTGTGKTTVLATLLGAVARQERIVLVEDAAELRPAHPHVVRLEGRPANAEGAGALTLADLVRQALRMRPDRLVVGEVRGAEVVDLLAALNTGHDGGATTLHANRLATVPARFEALCAAAGMPRAAAHSQLAAAVQAVVHLHRDRAGRRRVAGVGLLVPQADGIVGAVAAYSFGASTVTALDGAPALERALGP